MLFSTRLGLGNVCKEAIDLCMYRQVPIYVHGFGSVISYVTGQLVLAAHKLSQEPH